MLNAIKAFFEENILSSDKSEEGKQHALRLATTALLIEMMRMDDHFHDAEQKMLIVQIKACFKLTDTETEELVGLASAELQNSTDYYQFTSLINQHFEYNDKLPIIEALWEIAYADDALDIDEEYLVRKVSELLYVSHADFIAAKLRVKNR
ncbi:MAG: TerB family tellurite resistance protein [Gammaproteobacteria bacterium]|nr:TerB family tellurite resistance protein [Gammaproteobacteria bacterium]